MYFIGPYRFTETDAQRTVRYADEVFDLYGQDRDAAVIEHLRPPQPTGDLENDHGSNRSRAVSLCRQSDVLNAESA